MHINATLSIMSGLTQHETQGSFAKPLCASHRVHLQVCSELRGVQEQLLFCQDQQERFEAEMHRWRTLFGSFAALAAPNAAALPGAPGLMQISPTGAEGSNVMARRSPEVQVRAGTPRASQTALQQALTTSPPVARIGSTAGEPELAVLLGLHPGRLHPSFAQTVRKVMQSGCKVYKPGKACCSFSISSTAATEGT